jgi:hypothetical protein
MRRADPVDLMSMRGRMARLDARSCRIAGVARPHTYTLTCMSLAVGGDYQFSLVVPIEGKPNPAE